MWIGITMTPFYNLIIIMMGFRINKKMMEVPLRKKKVKKKKNDLQLRFRSVNFIFYF